MMKNSPEPILERGDDAGIARITLNRPDKRNVPASTLVKAFFSPAEDRMSPEE